MCNRMNTFVWISRVAALGAAFLSLAAPASAQYRPRPVSNPTSGENFHIELGADLWMPSAEMTVSSQSLNIPGSQIDFKRDLGLQDQHFPALQVMLRPAKRHKLRLQYIPVNYTQTATLSQRLVFNGIAYNLGVPVNSTLDWKTYQFGYEYDFIQKNSGFVGVILEAKYTDVTVTLASPLNTEFAHAKGPIPAIGGIFRYYAVPTFAITGEITGVKIPDSVSTQYHAHYVDVDIYGTLNLTNNIGVKAGYRSRDVGYLIKTDTGAFVMQGLYFGGVLRY